MTPSSNALADPDSELDKFVYSVSHDLQEPIRLIMSFQNLLVSKHGEQLPDEAKQYLDFATANAEKLQRMIRALVDYSRIGRSTENEEPVDLNTLLQDVNQSFSQDFGKREGRFVVGEMPTVVGRPSQMAQLFMKVLENVFHHTNCQSLNVTVSARACGNFSEISVKDNGEGIYQGAQPQVFHIFKKAGQNDSGTGVGLAIAKAIVENHGGKIWLESSSSEGTDIRFTLPV